MRRHTRYPDIKVFEEVLGALDITSVVASIYELCICYSELNGATCLRSSHTSSEKVTYKSSAVHHYEASAGKEPTARLVEAIEEGREVQSEHYFSKPLSRLLLFREMYIWKLIQKVFNKYVFC